MANTSSDSVGSCNIDNLEHKSRDEFQGKDLIDRLLVYFSKFQGSREKARRYAQKLLDLGHIESLSHSTIFEDSLREYRWTDVASVVNKAKTKAQENLDSDTSNNSNNTSQNSSFESPQPKVIVRQKEGRPTVRISIEADNCDGAEIQAHIRTNPKAATTRNAAFRTSTKNGDAVQYTEIQNGKMISFVTETSKTEEVLRMVPVSAMSQRNFDDSPVETFPVDVKIITRSPEPKIDNIPHDKENNTSSCDSNGDSALEEDKSSTAEVPSPIVNTDAPGQGDNPSGNPYPTSSEREEHSGAIPNASNGIGVEKSETTPEKLKVRPSIHKYKWEASEDSFQSEFKSDTRISTFNRPSDSLVFNLEKSSTKERNSVSNTAIENGKASTPKLTQNQEPRKLKFKEDSDWIKMRREYLENEEIREMTQRSGEHEVELFDDPGGCSLHSTGPHETIEEESETEENEVSRPPKHVQRDPSTDLLKIPPTSLVTVSPPPPSPISPRKPSEPGIKSLFWTKISCEEVKDEEAGSVFWMNVEKNVKFDENEFSKLFSKPPPSPVKTNTRSVIQEDKPGSKTLKVLNTERSRQVGIRASSIRLPAEDIHDAIINMDDSQLNLDALEALYDIRPTPDELDDIADALKRNPTGILDRPEQFVLMLAMLSNLDERLKSWIFIKKFPDKVLDIKEQLNTVSNVCIQVVRNPTLQKLLEATLAFGNFMNKGTQRGDADGYFLDVLPKLKDVKSQGGDTNLMLYLVQWMISEKEKSASNSDIMHRQDSKDSGLTQNEQDDNCGLPNQTALQKSCASSFQDTLDEIDILSAELTECKEQLMPAVIEGATCLPEIKPFNERMKDFVEQAEKALEEVQTLSLDATCIADEFKRYYVPDEAKKESLAGMLKHMSTFCEDFRFYWDEQKRNVAKEAFFNAEKARRQRMTAVKIAKSPSALKARFLEKRRREKSSNQEEQFHPNGAARYYGQNQDIDKSMERPPGRHDRTRAEHERQSTTHRTSWQKGSTNKANERQDTPVRPLAATKFRQNGQIANGGMISNNATRKHDSGETSTQNGGLSKMKQAMMKRRMLLKSKTC